MEALNILKDQENREGIEYVDQGFQNFGHFISVLILHDLIALFDLYGFKAIELIMKGIGV